jgi:type I restriction-modification system DNA methylase subunit
MTTHTSSAIGVAYAHARGVLSTDEVGRVLIALLALRASLEGHFSRVPVSHDVAGALSDAVTRVSTNRPELADALTTLLAPAYGQPAVLPTLVRAVSEVAPEEKAADLLAAISKILAENAKNGPVAVTAHNLLQLMSRLAVRVNGARVCDPFCGPGLLLAALGTQTEHRPSVVRGWERNAGAVALGRAVLAALGAEGTVSPSHALVSPPSEEIFDAVVTAPPFGVSPPKELHLEAIARFRFGIPTRHADWLFVQHALSVLAPGGTAVALMTKGPLFRGGSELPIRRRLIEADLVDTVISLPSGLLSGTALPCCLVVLWRDRPRSRAGSTLVIDLPKGPSTSPDLTDQIVADVLRANDAGEDATRPLRARRLSSAAIAAADYSLDPIRYLPPEENEPDRPIEQIVDELRQLNASRDTASFRLAEAYRKLLAESAA